MNHASEKSKRESWRQGTVCDGEGQVDIQSEELSLLELLAVALELRRSAWLSHGWLVNHMVLQGSTTRTTSSKS
jgi:hypothetical protein